MYLTQKSSNNDFIEYSCLFHRVAFFNFQYFKETIYVVFPYIEGFMKVLGLGN